MAAKTERETEREKNENESKSKNIPRVRKRRRSKGIVIDQETGKFAGVRRIVEIAGAYYIGVPREFVEAHGLKGKSVHIMGKDTMQIIPYSCKSSTNKE